MVVKQLSPALHLWSKILWFSFVKSGVILNPLPQNEKEDFHRHNYVRVTNKEPWPDRSYWSSRCSWASLHWVSRPVCPAVTDSYPGSQCWLGGGGGTKDSRRAFEGQREPGADRAEFRRATWEPALSATADHSARLGWELFRAQRQAVVPSLGIIRSCYTRMLFSTGKSFDLTLDNTSKLWMSFKHVVTRSELWQTFSKSMRCFLFERSPVMHNPIPHVFYT